MVTLTASAKSSQNVVLPEIAELFNDKFLDVLLPPAVDAEYEMVVDPSETSTAVETPKNPMIEALKATRRTLSAGVDALAAVRPLFGGVVDGVNDLATSVTVMCDVLEDVLSQVKLLDQKLKTPVVKKTCNPMWGTHGTLSVSTVNLDRKLEVSVCHKHSVGGHKVSLQTHPPSSSDGCSFSAPEASH